MSGIYKPSMNKQVYKLALLGATDVEIADFFEVTTKTINVWKKKHPNFFNSMTRGKMQSDSEVADRLYQRAMGYSHPDVHITNYKGVITVTKITKHYPPDTTAAIFWLKNRRGNNNKDPEAHKWGDKQEVEVSGEINVVRLPQKKEVGADVFQEN